MRKLIKKSNQTNRIDMQYIDKTGNASQAYQVVDTLMADAWNEDEKRYIDFNYNGLGKAEYRDKIIKLCLQEQTCFCCYCMREIVIDETSLEHIIPQVVSEIDFCRYLIVSELTDNISHKNQFDHRTRIEKLKKYPHDIAYHNLIASCRSKINCNSKRGNNYIEPIMYYKDIADKIWYEKNGAIGSDEFITFLDILGLNHNELKYIRKLWQLFSEKFETLPNMITVTQQDLDDMIYDAIAIDDDLVILLERFVGHNNQLSKVFRQYQWFFDYYKKL